MEMFLNFATMCFFIQCTRSSHVDSGGAYGSAVFGGKGVMSMGKFVHFS